jgi:hypothetical protein
MAAKLKGSHDLSRDWIVDRLQFWFIFGATFVVLVAAALVGTLLPWTWRRRPGSDEHNWFIGRAWHTAGTLTELAFMG